MTFPDPYPGLVIRYAYLWRREFEAGRAEALKDRPCAVVLVVTNEDGDQEVLVLPVTHGPPTDPADAIEIPTITKNRLGLDAERSWIVLSEANEFVWPGHTARCGPASSLTCAMNSLSAIDERNCDGLSVRRDDGPERQKSTPELPSRMSPFRRYIIAGVTITAIASSHAAKVSS